MGNTLRVPEWVPIFQFIVGIPLLVLASHLAASNTAGVHRADPKPRVTIISPVRPLPTTTSYASGWMQNLAPVRSRAPIRSRGCRLSLLLLLTVTLPLTACLPIVSHGPTVVPGLGVTATAAAGLGGRFSPACEFSDSIYPRPQHPDERACPRQKVFGVGPLFVVVGRGWSARASGWAYSARLHLPGPVDLYAQAPRKAGWDRGVGILLSPLQVSPYAQFGPAHGRWYSTQQIWLLNALELERDYITPAYWWVPSLTWIPSPRRGEKAEESRFRFHLTGGLGAERQRHRADGERPLRPRWSLSAGLSIDLFRPAPDPPR